MHQISSQRKKFTMVFTAFTILAVLMDAAASSKMFAKPEQEFSFEVINVAPAIAMRASNDIK